MIWKKFRVSTTSQAEEIVAATLAECGVEGVEIVDNIPLTEDEKRQMFVDIAPDKEDDGSAFLYFYLDPEEDTEGILARVREELEELRNFCDIGSCAIDISETEDIDWLNNWKKYFHQFRIDDILIVPSWEEPEGAEGCSLVLRIDPGTAFGTGMHETTQLCVRQMKKHITPGAEVLDIGCGSGILAITACRLGAGHSVATDIDRNVLSAVKENCEANGVAFGTGDGVEVLLGNMIDDRKICGEVGKERYDIVFSNILAEVLVPLAPAAAAAMKTGALWITSGILEGRQQSVKDAAAEQHLTLIEESRQGEWVSLTFRK